MNRVVVRQCRVRIVNLCPWVSLDNDELARAARKLIAQHLVGGMLDAQRRRGASLEDARIALTVRATDLELATLARSGELPIDVAGRLAQHIDAAIASLPIGVEFVRTPGDEPDHDERTALWIGTLRPITARRPRSRTQGALRFPRTHERTKTPQEVACPTIPGISTETLRDSTNSTRVRLDEAKAAGVASEAGPAASRWNVAPHIIEAPVMSDSRSLANRLRLGTRMAEGAHHRNPPYQQGVDRMVAARASNSTTSPPADTVEASTGARRRSVERDASGNSADGILGHAAVRSVLPYLVLGSLDQLGILNELIDACSTAGLDNLVADVVVALARKVLGPAPPGETDSSPLVVAGLVESPNGSHLDLLEWRVCEWLDPVVSFANSLVHEGLDEWSGLVVASIPGQRRLLLAESDGLFPIAWDASPASVGRWTRAAPCQSLEGDTRAVRMLAERAHDSLTVNPTRTQTLRKLRKELHARRVAPWADCRRLESGIAALVATALADIAHRVFVPLGPSDPVQALTHFGDMDANVSFEIDRVVVQIAVGRRHADLRDAGLLETIENVPWLGGRNIEIVGG